MSEQETIPFSQTMDEIVLDSDPRGRIFVDPTAWTDMTSWHEQAAELRNEPPIRVEPRGFTPFWALTRHADVFEASRRSDVMWNTLASVLAPIASLQWMIERGIPVPKTLIHMDGEEHTKYRGVTSDWFRPSEVKRRSEDIDAIADEYIELMAGMGGECDFASDIAQPFTLRVIMSIFGVPKEDEKLMLELTQGLFGASDPEFSGGTDNPEQRMFETVMQFVMYFADLTNKRREVPTDDLATLIATGQVDGCPMGDIERLWYYIIVATAGHDTTSFAMSGGMQALLANPDQLADLSDNPALAVNAAEEMFRWTSPVRHFLRFAQEDVTIGELDIPAGEAVLLSYPAANRDERVFENGMQFDIRRPGLERILSFGVGKHYCLGAHYARRELRTFIPRMFERFTDFQYAGDAQWAEAHFVSGVKHLPITYRTK